MEDQPSPCFLVRLKTLLETIYESVCSRVQDNRISPTSAKSARPRTIASAVLRGGNMSEESLARVRIAITPSFVVDNVFFFDIEGIVSQGRGGTRSVSSHVARLVSDPVSRTWTCLPINLRHHYPSAISRATPVSQIAKLTTPHLVPLIPAGKKPHLHWKSAPR